MDIHQVIAQNVREFRNRRGVSQERLAEVIGVDRTFISKIERGERNTTAETLARIAKGLGTVPHVLLVPEYFASRVGQMELDLSSLAESVDANPSLMSFVFGYHAEYMARREISRQLGVSVDSMTKPDDHDRTQHGDIILPYKGRIYSIEVKCLQGNSVKKISENDEWFGRYQCDGSDATDVTIPDGRTIHTVALQRGLFDIVAVGLFAFGDMWRFAFIKEEDLESLDASRGRRKDMPDDARRYFIKTTQDINWPLLPPYTTHIFDLL